jgi:hypothetical protein
MSKQKRQWNWCRRCQDKVLEVNRRVEDGHEEIQCGGCDTWFSIIEKPTEDGKTEWAMSPVPSSRRVTVGSYVQFTGDGWKEVLQQYLFMKKFAKEPISGGEKLTVVRFVAGYSRKLALVQTPYRAEPIPVYRKFLCLDDRETREKRASLRDKRNLARKARDTDLSARVEASL